MPRIRSAAPQDAAAGPSTNETRRTTRATRSQTRSASVEPAQTQRSQPRATRSGRKQKTSVDDSEDGSEEPEFVAGRAGGRRQGAAPLASVPEDLEVEPLEELITDAEAAAHEHVELEEETLFVRQLSTSSHQAQALVVRDLSASPAVTVSTTFSQSELRNLDPDLIMASLADLDDYANRLLKLLVPQFRNDEELVAHIEQLHEPRSKLSKLVNARSKALTAAQDVTFGSQAFITPSYINRSLLDTDDVDNVRGRSWRPDAILYEANLANFVNQLCRMSPNDERIVEVLGVLDSHFPLPFLSDLEGQDEPGSSALLGLTAQLALELRTQLAVLNMVRHEPETFDEVTRHICQMFMDTNDADVIPDTLGVELYTRTWDGIPFSQEDIAPRIVQRIDELREPFNEVRTGSIDASTARREIEKRFSWFDFLTILLEWAHARHEELSAQLAREGGAATVVASLERKIERRRNDPEGADDEDEGDDRGDDVDDDLAAIEEPVPPPISSAGLSSSKKGYTKGAMAFLRHGLSIGHKPDSSNPHISPRRSVQSVDASRHTPTDPHQDDFQDVDDVAADEAGKPASVSPMRKMLHAVYTSTKENQSKSEQQKKKSFVDPQDNGERVEWDDNVTSQEIPDRPQFRQPRNMLPPEQQAISPRKRHREDDVEDPSDDDGFQTDTRQPATKRPRVHPPRSSHQRVQTPEAGLIVGRRASSQSRPQASTSTAYTPRKNPGQLIEPPSLPVPDDGGSPPPLTAAQNYHLVNQTAKMYGRTHAYKPARVRKPWTEDEINRLIDLIAEHGCSWAMLKNFDEDHGHVLAEREQLDLRDKARNMKVDFLIAHQDLPTNFDQIQLDQKAIRKLADRGILYDQARMRSRRVHEDS